MRISHFIALTESSRVGEARRQAATMARHIGFGETEIGKISIVATEASNNLVKHARHGQVILRLLAEPEPAGLEILTLDRGPGMKDVSRCLEDGYSTAGSPGTGLGAISRLSHAFDLFSLPETGTVLMSRFYLRPDSPSRANLEIGAICVPQAGETACGDSWSLHEEIGRSLLTVVDGLGHGPLAATAASEATRVFHQDCRAAPLEILKQAHNVLRATRGASMAVAEIRFSEPALRFAGVGNISGVILGEGGSRSLISHNGTVGHELHRFQEFLYPWTNASLLVLSSDGLQTRWNIDFYPGLRKRHPSLIAGALYRDFQRGRDDVTVVVAGLKV